MRKILNILSLYMGLLVSAVLFFSFITPGYAMDVTLQWDANSEPDLNHYVVYWGTSSGNYTASSNNNIDKNTPTYTITDLTDGYLEGDARAEIAESVKSCPC